jgi:acyl carrier protein
LGGADKGKDSSMQLDAIAERIRSYICQTFLTPSQSAALTSSDNLLGLLDSLQALRLVVQLESMFEIKVADSDLTPENLGSIDKMAAYVARQKP